MRGQYCKVLIEGYFETSEAVVDQNVGVEIERSVDADAIAEVLEDKRFDGSVQLENVVSEGEVVEPVDAEIFG